MKELGAKGEPLTSQSLYDALYSKEKIKALLSDEDKKDDSKTNIYAMYSQIEDLEASLQKTKSQKESMIRQLNDLEDSTTRLTGLFHQVVAFFMEFLRHQLGDLPFSGQFDAFKKMLRKKSSIDVLDEAFRKLKNDMLHAKEKEADLQPDKGKSKFFFKRLMSGDFGGHGEKDDQVTYLKMFKETYQDIINELGLELGGEYISKLVALNKKVYLAESTDEFDALRDEILSLLQHYIDNVSNEREKAARLITDVVDRLSDVQLYFSESQEFMDETKTANDMFGKKIENHVKALKDNMEFSKTLEELQAAVSEKLQTIIDTIQEKNAQDKQRDEKAKKKIVFLQDNVGKLKGLLVKAREKAKKLEKEMLRDPLTGAFNRRAYEKSMDQEFKRYLRYKRIFSVLLFDVDHFKVINDTYGHAVGDKCLKEIIIRVGKVLRENDILARFGGEEFIALLPETEAQGAMDVAEKLRKAVENIEFLHKEEVIKITISVGVTRVRDTDRDIAKLFERMDIAMYEAKNSGRNKVVLKE